MLRIDNLDAGYGDVKVLRQVSLQVGEGKIVALIGANGAGKTTLLRAVSGLIRASAGTIFFRDRAIHALPSHKIVQSGLIQVPEGRRLFPDMSVWENLEMGAYRRGRSIREASLKTVINLFPRLEERKNQLAGTLSGGEQQMLAIGRALMSRPKLLMLDEPSLGLAPMLVASIFKVIQEIRDAGTTVLIVEQNAMQTLAMADQGYVMENGEIVYSGPGSELLENEEIRSAYLGL